MPVQLPPKKYATNLVSDLEKEIGSYPNSLTRLIAIRAAKVCVKKLIDLTEDTWSRIPEIGEYEDYIPYLYLLEVQKEIDKL